MKRGIYTVADLKARSVVDPVTGCWHWQGGMSSGRSSKGRPRQPLPSIWTFDHQRGEKRSMSGPRAVWNIAHGCAPLPGWLVFRRCLAHDCVNPVHHKDARGRAEIGLHIHRNGKHRGEGDREQRSAAGRAAARARGCRTTTAEAVIAIRAADPALSNLELARLHGLGDHTVSDIRRGKTWAWMGVSA